MVEPPDPALHTDYSNGRLNLSGIACLCLLEAIGYRASLGRNTQVAKLEIQGLHTTALCSLGSGWVPHVQQRWAARYPVLVEAFSHLTDLTLSVTDGSIQFTSDGELVSHGDGEAAEETLQLLRSAKSLKKLVLAYNNGSIAGSQSYLRALFEDPPHWPLLERLDLNLSGERVPHDLLLEFLSSMASTLSALALRKILVGDAGELIKQIPKVLKLRDVCLGRIWHYCAEHDDFHDLFVRGTDYRAPYEQSVRAYLLAETLDLPELRLCPTMGRGDAPPPQGS